MKFENIKTGSVIVTKFETFVVTNVLKNSVQFYNDREYRETGKRNISSLHRDMFNNSLFRKDLISIK